MKFIIYTNYTNFFIALLLPLLTHSKSFRDTEFEPASLEMGIDPVRVGLDDSPGIIDGNYLLNPALNEDIDQNENNDRYERDDNEKGEEESPLCAVMYKNNEPVGILQPFEDSYKFLPVGGEPTLVDINPIPVKKKSIIDVLYPANVDDYDQDADEKLDEKIGYTDDKYPSIFAKFKIDSRLDKNIADSQESKRAMTKEKRNSPNIDNDHFDSLKSTLSKIKTDDNIEVEEELRNILDDMGLIDDYPQEKEKREVEDENLELGTNKISLVNEQPDARDKRQEINEFKESTAAEVPMINDISKSADILNLINDFTTQASAEVKMKREDTTANEREPRQSEGEGIESEQLDSYEKRVEREIKDKIEKLKEEVRKEIEQLKGSKDKSKNNDDWRRKKRQTYTLMNEENKDIDPNLNTDGELKIHVRRKRNLNRKAPSKFLMRSLKQFKIAENKRTKREVAEVLERYDNDREAAEYEDYGQNAAEVEDEKRSKLEVRDDDESKLIPDPNCNCDKNGNNCKCSYANDQLSGSEPIVKKSITKNCNCDKSGHCTCENQPQETNLQTNQNSIQSVENLPNSANKPAPLTSNEELSKRATSAKRFQNGEYFVDLQPEIYKLSPANNQREKRQDFEDFLAGYGRIPAGNHLVAIKQRSALPHSRFRRRIQKENDTDAEPRQLIDMSEEDIFGALPQSFEGELMRYKRVKRTKTKT